MQQYIIGGIIGLFIGVVGTNLLDMARQGDHDDHKDHGYEDHSHDDDIMLIDAEAVVIAPGVSITPISHASAVVQWNETLIFADPVGEANMYTEFGTPDIVFITHRHGDHFDQDNLPAMLSESTTLIAPQDVVDQLPEGIVANVVVMAPGETATVNPLTLEAVAAYNTRPEAQDFHPQSRGDIGVVLDDGTSRVYFSGDTEGTPEMLALQNIDVAFVSMNLPYTMDVEAAAEAVLGFAPKAVYPYHFRTPDGFSDVERFKELVEAGSENIEVKMLDWYSE
jgi:L-ascorbate metabolism protein UlaG (beta-lactamase superfamily)